MAEFTTYVRYCGDIYKASYAGDAWKNIIVYEPGGVQSNLAFEDAPIDVQTQLAEKLELHQTYDSTQPIPPGELQRPRHYRRSPRRGGGQSGEAVHGEERDITGAVDGTSWADA